jgi:hypothetical protein
MMWQSPQVGWLFKPLTLCLRFLCLQAVLLEGKAWQSRADELAAQLATQQEAQEAAAAAVGGGCVLRGPEADAAAERDIGDLEALIGGFCYMYIYILKISNQVAAGDRADDTCAAAAECDLVKLEALIDHVSCA